MFELKPVKELDKLSLEEQKKYCQEVMEYTNSVKSKVKSHVMINKVLSMVSPALRNYDFTIEGENNLPKDQPAIFVINHSNSHDFFTIQEAFGQNNRKVSPIAASDCLTYFTQKEFELSGLTLMDRNDKESCTAGTIQMVKNLMMGIDVVICGESTWNIHPTKVMQPVKYGAAYVAALSGCPIIPTIFEYVEVPDVVDKEKELYSQCIVKFGKPIMVNLDEVAAKTKLVQSTLEEMRSGLWNGLGIKKESLDDVNKDIYLNHTYLKKFGDPTFEYDSAYESQFLLKDKNGRVENEYTLNENNQFVPGVTPKR